MDIFESRTSASASGAAPRLLVVEDEAFLRELFQTVLSREGYRVEVAADGTEAKTRLDSNRYELMLVDVNLPGLSGLQLFEHCKKRNPSTEVIIVTGAPDILDAVSTVKHGAFDYLAKPVPADTLRSKVKEALAVQWKREAQELLNDLQTKPDSFSVRDFRVVRVLGGGTMGTLFLVEKDGLFYAMKTLKSLPTDQDGGKSVQRFIREGQIVAGLNHENIVKVYELNFGTFNRTPYILMEYVEGESLRALIEKGTLSLRQKVTYLRQVAAALVAVHTAGILHRDIKPSNVIVDTKKGVAKLTDFGIARLRDSTLTLTDEILGTPAYISPEGFTQESPKDARSDLFSFGVLAYHLLAGKLPFAGEDLAGLAVAIMYHRPPSLKDVQPAIPPAVQAIVDRLLEKDPTRRFQSALEVVAALQGWDAGEA
jgi:CheY-like chemotaxis protein